MVAATKGLNSRPRSASPFRQRDAFFRIARDQPEGTGLPPASDHAYAKVAAAEAVSRDDKDTSLSWENPASGARGTVTPLAAAYRVEGDLCRDFLASYVTEAEESWLQGEACRASKGKWEVRRLKAWRRS